MTTDICPCVSCTQRRMLIRNFDVHVWGTDCPYLCEEFNKWASKEET